MTIRLLDLRLTTQTVTVLAFLVAVAMFALAPGGGSVANAQEGVPDKPEGLTGRLLQFGSAELDWKDVQGAETYEAQYWDNTDTSNNFWADPPSVEYDGSSAVLSGLPNQHVFYFQVRARNPVGPSEWSDYIRVTNPGGRGWRPTIVNICDRTPQVRDATLAKLPGVSDCSVVTDVDLGGIKQEIDLTGQNISELKAADFQGLTRLQSLRLNNNDLTILPDNVFDGLTSLEWLKLKNNDLSELPDNVFDDLASLRSLSLDDNDLGELPDNVFDGLANLSSLSLDGNDLGELPDNVFDGLSNLEYLILESNGLSELPDNVFDDLTRLEGLYLRDNDLEEMPSRVFDDLASLEFLALQDNSLSELPPGVFDGLAKLQELSLTRNDLGELPDNVFDDLAEVTTLSLDGNDLKELRPGVFDGLSNLEWLQLGSNDLSELPDGVFDGLSKLEDLYLYDNDLRDLPAGVFDGLSKLERLQLGSNDLSELPDGVLDGLSKLEYLYLYDNDLRELPAGMFEGIHGLKGLYLTRNPGSTFVLTAELKRRGDDEFVVKVAQGAPFKITVTLSAQGGTLSPTYVEILGGRTTSGPIFIRSVEPEASQVTISVDSTAFTDYLGIGVGLPSVHGIQTGPGAPLVMGEAEPVNTPATGAPTISGTAQVGEMLTADMSGIADADGLSSATFGYQWLSSRDTEIQGATDVSYTIVAADEGKTIKVRVTFTDDTGHEETLTSAPTATVPAAVPPASGPAVAIGLSPSGSVAEGTETTVTMSFGGLERDSDPNDVDYIFRADVVSRADGNSADICEGKGIGSNRNFNQVDEDPEVRTGTVSASCTPGDYTLEVSITAADNVQFSAAAAIFAVVAQTPVEAPRQGETDTQTTEPMATIELSPSGSVAEGTEVTVTMSFANLESDSDTSTTDYTFRADVVNADACEGGGTGNDRYMYKVDEDPEVRTGSISTSCAPGDYTVEVSISSPGNAELASATADFTVATPAQQQPPPEPPASTDATLSNLALSNVDFGVFTSSTTEYTASVANDVDETTVTPTTNDDGATYEIKLGGVADVDGTVSLAVGSNVITIKVTAEDGNTVKTYTVTVTRAAPPSNDATLSGLTLSGIDFGAFDSATTGYTASVANDVAETTVTPTTNDDGATDEIKLGGVADADGTVSLAVGSNVITIKVTAEDGETTKTYTVTVTRAEAPAPEPTVAIELSSDSVEEGTEITVTMSFANLTPDNDANLVFRADVVGADGCEGQGIGVARNISKVDEDPEIRTGTISGDCTAGDYTLEVSLTDDDVELASARADFAVVEPEPTDEPKPTAPPDVPDKPTGEVTGKGQVRLDWNDVEGATYYQVRFYGNEDWVELPTDEISLVLDGSGATASNLPDYGFYYFAVRAGNAAGVSEWSDFLTLPNPEQ